MNEILFHEPTLLWSDASCALETLKYGRVPLLVDVYGNLVESASDWLRTLTIGGKTLQSSVEQYAYSLKSYWGFLHSNRIDWRNIDDGRLRIWRNQMRNSTQKRGHQPEKKSINSKLEVVLSFYRWAQENFYIRGVIGVTQYGAPPFPLSLHEVHKRNRTTFHSGVLYRITRRPRCPIPSNEETNTLFEKLAQAHHPETGERNCLLINWVLASGLRRFELISLRLVQLPSRMKAIADQEAGVPCYLRIIGKGGHIRDAPVTPEVVMQTWDYIEGTRTKILRRCCLRQDHQYVFIGRNSGQPLNLQYVSRVVSRAFSFASRKLTLHRMRARFTSLYVKCEREAEVRRVGLAGLREETILFKAAEILGHKDINSIRYYLNLDLDEEWRVGDRFRAIGNRSSRPTSL